MLTVLGELGRAEEWKGGGGGALGSELMIGNDGAGDTWDNDGVANAPDEKMKAHN